MKVIAFSVADAAEKRRLHLYAGAVTLGENEVCVTAAVWQSTGDWHMLAYWADPGCGAVRSALKAFACREQAKITEAFVNSANALPRHQEKVEQDALLTTAVCGGKIYPYFA